MDYCHPCRRHLNGALACPGCGTPAQRPGAYEAYEPYEQPAAHASPPGPWGTPEPDRHAVTPDRGAAAPDRHAAAPGLDAADPADGPRSGSADDCWQGSADDPPSAPVGDRRSALSASAPTRRDRKAATHRRRRRRALLITSGFTLAAAGLSLAELGRDAPPASPGRTAADAAAARSDTPEESPSDMADTPYTGTADPAVSASPSTSEKEKEKTEPSPEGDPSSTRLSEPTTSAPPSPPPTTTAPGSPPPPAAPTTAPTKAPNPPKTTPQPDPTQTCERFLWWCA